MENATVGYGWIYCSMTWDREVFLGGKDGSRTGPLSDCNLRCSVFQHNRDPESGANRG